MSKKGKREPPKKWECISDHERFIRIFESMFESPAFRMLTPVATKVYLILKNEYRGNYTMNNIICPYSTFEENNISRNSISPALKLLEAMGFIDKEPGNLMRQPSKYHFSDRWREVKDDATARKIRDDVQNQIRLEKMHRKEAAHLYDDE